METITIVAIDDHPLIRQAIKSIVGTKENMELVAEGAVASDALKLTEQYQPDVLLLDLNMPRDEHDNAGHFQALPTIARLRDQHPHTSIIILTQHYIPVIIRGAIQSGVSGYLLKSDDLSLNLSGAIETVAQGGAYFSETVSQKLFKNEIYGRWEEVNLTKRQIDMLIAIYNSPDASYAEHAKNLEIKVPTFKAHLSKAFKALGVANATSAIIRCIELGIINTEV